MTLPLQKHYFSEIFSLYFSLGKGWENQNWLTSNKKTTQVAVVSYFCIIPFFFISRGSSVCGEIRKIFISISSTGLNKSGYQINSFLISPWKHLLWYSLEEPRLGASKEYPQNIFLWRNTKNINTFGLKKHLIKSYAFLSTSGKHAYIILTPLNPTFL